MSAALIAMNVLAAAGAGDPADGADAGGGGGVCSVPGVDQLCQAAGNAVNSVTQTAVQAFVDDFAEAFGKTLKAMVTFWTDVPTPNLDSAPVHLLNGLVYWLQGAVLVASLLFVAAKMMLTRRSEVAVMTGVDLIRMVVFIGAGVPAIDALAAFGDSFSQWILNQSANGSLAENFLMLGGGLAGLQGLGIGLEFLVALLGSLSGIAQIFLLLARIGILILLVGTLPLTASAMITGAGKASFNKVLGWIVAWVAYKPAAAMVYAAAFILTGRGTDLVSILSGILLMVLAVFALPTLMRLVVPAVAAATSSGGGTLVAAGAGGALATGAQTLMQNRGGDSGGAGGGQGGGGGAPAQQPGLAPEGAAPGGATSSATNSAGAPGPSGAGAAGGEASAAGAGAGAAGAATAGVGAVVVGGAMLAKGAHDVTKTAATSVADDTTGGA